MRIPGSPRSKSGVAPSGSHRRAIEKGVPHIQGWGPGLKKTAILFWIVLAGLAIPQLQTEAAVDEHNVEQYATKRSQPTYPPLAQKQRIEGVVVIQVSVGSSGKVTNAEFVRGNNIFKAVSLEAARRWEFKVPTGEGIEGTIRFTFKLE